MFSASAFRSPSAIRSTYLGCVPKTSAATSIAITWTVQTVSFASNMSVSNPNSEPFASQAALAVHGLAFQPTQPTNGFTPQLENRVGLTSQPPAVSVISTEPTRFQLQPPVPRSIEQNRDPVHRGRGNFQTSQPQPVYVQRPIPQYATSTNIGPTSNPAPLVYSKPTNYGRLAEPVTYLTPALRQHAAMQPMQTYSQLPDQTTVDFTVPRLHPADELTTRFTRSTDRTALKFAALTRCLSFISRKEQSHGVVYWIVGRTYTGSNIQHTNRTTTRS